MKRQSGKTRKPSGRSKSGPRQKATQAAGSPADTGRRDVLKLTRNLLILVGVLGAGGAYAVSAVRTTAFEQDLSRVGNGTASVVQIHDPGCQLCTALQRETRSALDRLEGDGLSYVVANIKTQDGAAFSARYGQPHVTLMLMDPDGALVRVLNGPQDRDDLEKIFAAHQAAYR